MVHRGHLERGGPGLSTCHIRNNKNNFLFMLNSIVTYLYFNEWIFSTQADAEIITLVRLIGFGLILNNT